MESSDSSIRNPVITNVKSPIARRGSLRRVFLLVVVMTYLVTVAGAFVAFYWSARSISDEYVERFAVAQSILERNGILSIVERELVLSRKLADDPQIRAWVLNEDDPVARETAEQQFASYHRFLGYGTVFAALRSSNHFYVTDGESADFSKTTLDPDNSGDRWFFESLERNEEYSLNVNYDAVLDEVRLWINVAVRDDSGRPIGVAGSGIDLTEFLDNLVAHTKPGLSSIIINSAGELQAHEDRSLIEHNARVGADADKITIFDLVSDADSRERLAAAMNSENDGQPRLFPLQMGDQVAVAALDSIPELDWHNLVLIDAATIIGPGDFFPLGLVFLLSLLGVLFALLFILNKLILNPLDALTQAAGSVAEGAYDTQLPPAGDDEIGTLSRSFESMTEKIREHTATLEARVVERTEVLAETNRELSASQERLMDSIQYGRLIQNSILPTPGELQRHLADYFTVHEPVDLVGGDFYFFRETEDGFCLATVDCTGHGVPGAFMTMMVNALLNRVIETHPDKTPGEMLETLHHLVQETLRREAGALSLLENGLDIAFCRVRRSERAVDFAGAGLPLFVMEHGELREIPGDRRHLGFSTTSMTPLTDHRLSIQPGNRYYLFTDGILDLPGGTNGFGLGRKRLKDILAKQDAPGMEEQGKRVRAALEEYQGD